MAIERTEQVGLGVAVVAHAALLALLSINWPDAPEAPIQNPPMAVDLIAETAPVSTAPEPATEPPAARRGEIDSEEPVPVPAPPLPKVTPRVAPPPPTPKRATPAPAPRPTPTPRVERRPPSTPRDTSERRRPDRQAATTPRPVTPAPTRTPVRPPRDTRAAGDPLGKIVDDVARTSSQNARGTSAPAAQTAAQVQQSIVVAVDREIAPFWQRNAPSGIDVDELRLVLEISLNRDGSVQSVRQLGELGGQNASNQAQHARFVEQAIRSVRQAAPFNLPDEHYAQWRVVRQPFRARLGS